MRARQAKHIQQATKPDDQVVILCAKDSLTTQVNIAHTACTQLLVHFVLTLSYSFPLLALSPKATANSTYG
jgi:hypothetical protein